PTANTGIDTRRFAVVKIGRFHTGSNGRRLPPTTYPASRSDRRQRPGAAVRSLRLIASLRHSDLGTPPRARVVSGNTETSTGVTAWNPQSSTSSHMRIASSKVVRGRIGGAFSTGILTVHA